MIGNNSFEKILISHFQWAFQESNKLSDFCLKNIKLPLMIGRFCTSGCKQFILWWGCAYSIPVPSMQPCPNTAMHAQPWPALYRVHSTLSARTAHRRFQILCRANSYWVYFQNDKVMIPQCWSALCYPKDQSDKLSTQCKHGALPANPVISDHIFKKGQ